jgi:hypothetical protein
MECRDEKEKVEEELPQQDARNTSNRLAPYFRSILSLNLTLLICNDFADQIIEYLRTHECLLLVLFRADNF